MYRFMSAWKNPVIILYLIFGVYPFWSFISEEFYCNCRRLRDTAEFIPGVRFTFQQPGFWKRLSPRDREFLRIILSFDYQALENLLQEYPEKVQIKYEELENPEEGRTVYLQLDTPLFIAGREIKFLRIKGVRPRVTEGGFLSPYTGSAHDPSPLMVDSKGNIYRGRESFDILGGMREEWAEVEFETTRMLTSVKGALFGVDYPLALGIIKNLEFVDEEGRVHNSAFIIFGMESPDVRFGFQGSEEEERAFLYFCYYYPQNRNYAFVRIPEEREKEIITAIGRALRDLHDKGVFHRYPTTTNIGIEPTPEGFRIIFRDLGDRILRENLNGDVRVQEIGWRFIDITRIIYDLHSTQRVAVEEDGLYFADADTTRLIPYFLRGYFYDIEISEEEIQPLLTPGFQQRRDNITYLSPLPEGDPVFGVVFKYLFEITPGDD